MITVASSKGIGTMDIGNSRNAKQKDRDPKEVDAFSSLMNMATISNNTVENSNNDNNSNSYDITASDNDEVNTNSYNKESSRYNKYKDSISNKEDNPYEIDAVDEGIEANTDEMNNSEAATKILNLICNELGISTEEAEGMLESMNLQISDLLDSQAAKEFVLTVKGASEMDVLTDESLSGLLEQIQGISEEQIHNEGINSLKTKVQDVESGKDIETLDIDESVNKSETKETTNSNASTSAEDLVSEDKTVQVQYNSDGANEDFNNNLLGNLNNAINNAVNQVEGNFFVNEISQADIIRQVIDQIKVNVSKEVTSMEINLTPENLGKVNVSVVSKNGVLSANILAETEGAKAAIEANLVLLKETFNNQDIKVESIEVMVGTSDTFNQNEDNQDLEQQKGNNKKTINGLNLESVSGEYSSDEIIQMEMMKMEGRSISYMA